GGEGIGRVTKPGLKVSIGQAAINPVPMEMITSAIQETCAMLSYTRGIIAVISIPGGEEVAKRTMNSRLGIVGGLSVLGTTGIVEPMSERAIIDTIKADIDVQIASVPEHCTDDSKPLLIAPGNYGKDFAERELGLDIKNAVKCSNFIGETLDYLCIRGVRSIKLVGHAGKLIKLAGGIMNTHSHTADCRMEILAAHAALNGASQQTIEKIMDCINTVAAIDVIKELDNAAAIWESLSRRIDFHISERTRGELAVEYIVFTLEHGILIHSKTARVESVTTASANQDPDPCEGSGQNNTEQDNYQNGAS
ncbi:MAG: cobalt-precorrin-5B (C(1))-methyltransferase CbiD, partial [Coriobacteriales bacterium]|nr:cobalt-precorrin-5B (C(1))-methyltransferase CbiD [Coriobacteriales bacterium]